MHECLITFFYNPVARVMIDLATAPPVLPPTMVRTERTANDEAMVRFEVTSPGLYNVRYYLSNDSDLVCVH